MHTFPQQEEAATGRSLMQQPRYGHCGADALPAESKPALVFPTSECVLYNLCIAVHQTPQ